MQVGIVTIQGEIPFFFTHLRRLGQRYQEAVEVYNTKILGSTQCFNYTGRNSLLFIYVVLDIVKIEVKSYHNDMILNTK
jgi:hypothetical protein